MVDTTEENVLDLLKSNQVTLWRSDRSAMVMQLLRPPPTLHIWLAGGEMDDLLSMRGGMEAWARSQGCEFVTINGRRGWARVLGPFGYEPDGEELRKSL
jgi:hypothetical protein